MNAHDRREMQPLGWLSTELDAVADHISLPGERRHDGALLVGRLRHADIDVPCAEIQVALRRPEADVRETVRHELLHVRLAELQSVLEQALSGLPPGEADVLRASYDSAEERAVNAIARALDD